MEHVTAADGRISSIHSTVFGRAGRALAALAALVFTSGGCEEPTVDGLRIFVTSTRQNADFGGIAGADELCANQASDAGLDGDFKAWLSTRSSPVTERIAHGAEPYVRTDGRLLANDWDDLLDGALNAPIDKDADGESRSGDVWTGTLADGQPYEGDDCAGFTSSAGGNAQCGDSESSTATWTENLTPSCSITLRLYCIEQPIL